MSIMKLDTVKFFILLFLSIFTRETNQIHVENFVGLVERHGYTAEEYNVTTTDGYILRLHRISGSPKSPKTSGKPVVYLQHGIFLSSDSWVLIGPEKDLAFLLADVGKDVWIGNVRGNTYARSHVSKNPESAEFWKFSYHEMAIYDVKEMIDFILHKTEQKKLTYYGYSMGTTISYVLLSMLPEYNQKIQLLYSAMPVVFWKHELRPLVAAASIVFKPLEIFTNIFKIHELLPQTAAAAYIGKYFCGDDSPFTQMLCVAIFSNIGLDAKRFNKTALPEILAHFPAGTSTVNTFNYYQNYKRDQFAAYDYGRDENLYRYGLPIPFEYNLTKVTVPVSIWYAKNDYIVNPKDVFELKKRLTHVKSIQVQAVNHPKFNHFDFLWAKDARELLYEKILDNHLSSSD